MIQVQRLTSVEAADRLSKNVGLAPDDLVLHKVHRMEGVLRGDITLHERPSCTALIGQGFRIYLWRDAWCITGNLDEIEDLAMFVHMGEEIMELQLFLEARSAM